MKRMLPLAMFFLFCGSASARPDQNKATANAKAVLEALVKEDFETASKDFSVEVKKALPLDKLKDTWKGILAEAGAFKKLKAVALDERGPVFVVTLTCEFEKLPMDVVVTVPVEGKAGVQGLFFSPNLRLMYKSPEYAKPDHFREIEVVVNPGEWELPGTLTLPKGDGPFPAAILVHGSGPQDRDQSIGPNLPFRDLAEGLATKGIAVLRYEKRTKKHGYRIVKLNIPLTIKEEAVDDAVAAAALLRARKDIDAKKIFIVGHSLGAHLAPLIGQRDGTLAGLVLLAGNTRPLSELMLEQFTYQFSLLEKQTDEQKKQLEEIKKLLARVEDPKLEESSLRTELILGAQVSYWLSLRHYNATETAASLKLPMLILQGERDANVTMTDFEGWKKALKRDNVHFKSYPSLNHLFMVGTGKAKPDEYGKVGHVSGAVIDDIAEWMKKQ